MIRFRIDVDYQYPSRIKSFICTALGIKTTKDYLRNSKTIARMINASEKKVKATWFFTPTTAPDAELLGLISNDRHEIAVHIVNAPYSEWKNLEKATGRTVDYYTIHGTARMLARIMWKRITTKSPEIPSDFPLQSFYQFPTKGLDVTCYSNTTEQALKIAEDWIKEGYILHFHPIWLFQRGKINFRGPYYETLRRILQVDKEFEAVGFRRKLFFTVARDAREYERNVIPTEEFIKKLWERGADLFSFVERRWCNTIPNPPKSWTRTTDNIALLRVTTYKEWWESIGKKTRNMIRKSEKSNVRTEITGPNEELAEGMWKIYNETPIRQERAFPHYGISLETVKKGLSSVQNAVYIGACLQDELVGFVQLIQGDNVTIISQILSLQKHWDKAVNNALVAKTIEVCSNRHAEWIMYGRIGNHPTLDKFKENNGFSRFPLTRYYIPLTTKGKIVLKLGLQKETKDVLPQSVKYPLIPIYNWTSRTKMKIRLRLKTKALS